MSENLRSQFPKIQALGAVTSSKLRQRLLDEFSKDINFCRAVREIVLNVRDKNVKISPKHRQKITARHRHTLSCLCEKQRSKRKFRSLVKQTGRGFFLPIVIPHVAEVIRSLVTKK